MHYLLIIAHDDAFVPTESLIRDIGRWVDDVQRRGVRVHGNPLRPPGDAITVRVRDGEPRLEPGPFSASKEQLCGYELLECGTVDEAVEIASTHPMARAASIEVRPVWSELTAAASA